MREALINWLAEDLQAGMFVYREKGHHRFDVIERSQEHLAFSVTEWSDDDTLLSRKEVVIRVET